MHLTLSEANLNARHEDRAPAQFRHSPQGFQIWMGASLIDARTLPVALLLISLARPIDVSQEAYFEGEWSERTHATNVRTFASTAASASFAPRMSPP